MSKDARRQRWSVVLFVLGVLNLELAALRRQSSMRVGESLQVVEESL